MHIESLHGKPRTPGGSSENGLARPRVCLSVSVGCLRVASMLIIRTNRDEGGRMEYTP